MNYLIIFSHPNGKSFSHKVLKTITDSVLTDHDQYIYRNLYEIDFNPVLTTDDLGSFRNNVYPEDIKTEQDYIQWADILVFIYPLWWGGMPAILKGYIDRVFANGFAYKYNDNNPIGMLTGKKAILISTQGFSKEYYDGVGMTQAMLTIEEKGIFEFCGVTLAGHLFFGNAPSITESEEAQYLDAVRQLFNTVK